MKEWMENHPRHEIEEWGREGILGPLIYWLVVFATLGFITAFGLWICYGQ